MKLKNSLIMVILLVAANMIHAVSPADASADEYAREFTQELKDYLAAYEAGEKAAREYYSGGKGIVFYDRDYWEGARSTDFINLLPPEERSNWLQNLEAKPLSWFRDRLLDADLERYRKRKKFLSDMDINPWEWRPQIESNENGKAHIVHRTKQDMIDRHRAYLNELEDQERAKGLALYHAALESPLAKEIMAGKHRPPLSWRQRLGIYCQ